jgi:acetylornithine deacetylase/succinyl-diaminopimelate desuccinylase-like protein
VLYITAGEETGSEGAFALAPRGMRGQAGAMVVAEPTTNRPLCGHTGALWLKTTTRGVTSPSLVRDDSLFCRSVRCFSNALRRVAGDVHRFTSSRRNGRADYKVRQASLG